MVETRWMTIRECIAYSGIYVGWLAFHMQVSCRRVRSTTHSGVGGQTGSPQIWSTIHQQLQVPDLPPDVSLTDCSSCPQQVTLVMMRPVASTAQSMSTADITPTVFAQRIVVVTKMWICHLSILRQLSVDESEYKNTWRCVWYSVRLVSREGKPREGRVEVWYNETWGTVCDRSITDMAAKVVCHQLNFGYVMLCRYRLSHNDAVRAVRIKLFTTRVCTLSSILSSSTRILDWYRK